MVKKLKWIGLFILAFIVMFSACICPTYFVGKYEFGGYVSSMIISLFSAIVFCSDYSGE